MAFQQVMFAAQTVDLLTPAEQTQTVDLLTGEEENKTVDLLTPAEPSAPIEQPIEQSKPIIEENKETENQTVDLLTPGDDEVVPEEGKKSTTTILIGGEEEEETQDDSWDLTPAEITVPEENHDEEEKKDATFEDEEHHENAGVLPWSTDLVKPWSIYREPKKVYRPGEDLDLTELLVEIKTGRSGSLYNIEDLINDEFTTITRTRKSDGEKVRLDDKIYEDETMTIHMDGCQDLTIDFTVDENLKDEEEALEAFQDNLIREEFRDGLDFSLYLIKKGERENPIVAYSLDPHKLTPIGNGVDKKLKDGPLFDLKDINTWDRFDIETIGKVKAILERSAEIKNTENVRKKLITQLAIWNVTSNIIPREIDATVSEIEENETNEFGPELKPTDEEEIPEEKEEEPIEIIDPTTPEEEIESDKQDDEIEAVEEKTEAEEKTETEEPAEEKTEVEESVEENTQENKESEKIEEQAPVQSTVHKIVFDVREIDLPYNEVELSDEEYALYNELTSLEAIELKSEDEDLKIYEPIIEETENPYADLVTIGESDIDSIERVETEVTFDAVDYSFQNLYHTLETSSMLGFGQPRDFNVLLKATMKASRKIVEGDKFEVEILSKTLPILNGEEGRAKDIQIDGKVVATAEYIAEEHKIVYTFVEDLDTDKVEIEQEFKQIKEEKAALLNMLDVSENLVLDAVRGAEGAEDSEENPDELEISPEFEENLIQLKLGNTKVTYNGVSFETKKFRLKTTMTAKAAPVWQIRKGWTFDINIGPYLKPEYDENSKPILNPLYDPNEPGDVIATPTYNPETHTITYTYEKDVLNTKKIDIDQMLAFDTEAIKNQEIIDINISVKPQNNNEQKMPTITVRKDDPRTVIPSIFEIDVDGNGEPNLNDGYEFFEFGPSYKVNLKSDANPVVENGEIKFIDWTVVFDGNGENLNNDQLDLITNFTAVRNSGLEEIQDVTLNGQGVKLDDNNMGDKFLINDSKHFDGKTGNVTASSYTFKFRTPVNSKQKAYVLDIAAKLRGVKKTGAVRLIMPAYEGARLEMVSPNDMTHSNRTTISGKFTAEDTAEWIVTEEVSTGDQGSLPLIERNISGNQKLDSLDVAYYGLDGDGKMVQLKKESRKDDYPIAAGNLVTNTTFAPGTIAVYEYKTSLLDSDKPQTYTLSDGAISKYRDVDLNIIWSRSEEVKDSTYPEEKVILIEDNNPKNKVEAVIEDQKSSGIKSEIKTKIKNVKLWNIGADQKPNRIKYNINQELPEMDTSQNPPVKFAEVFKGYIKEDDLYLIRNIIYNKETPNKATITIKKQSSSDNTGLEGAQFTLVDDGSTGLEYSGVTNSKGELIFNNVIPGTYVLQENVAPKGYKRNQETDIVTVDNDGNVKWTNNIIKTENFDYPEDSQGNYATEISHEKLGSYPSYMNAISYATVNGNNVNYYIYLKPDNEDGDGTNRNTILTLYNDNPANANSVNVAIYDVNPNDRDSVREAFENKDIEQKINGKQTVIPSVDVGKITINKTVYNGTQTSKKISFDKGRFGNDWGFIIKYTAQIRNVKSDTRLGYKWTTEVGEENSFIESESIIPKTSDRHSNNIGGTEPEFLILNEPKKAYPIHVTTRDDKKQVVGGAEITLYDAVTNAVLGVKTTDEKGVCYFENVPEGEYKLVETKNPEGLNKYNLTYYVTVTPDGEILYSAKDEDENNVAPGKEYTIGSFDINEDETTTKQSYIRLLNQSIELDETSGYGRKPGVWEEIKYEAFNLKASFLIMNGKAGQKFSIDFGKDWNATQWSGKMPDIMSEDGQNIVAKASFENNILTYTLQDYVNDKEIINASILIKSIRPSKYVVLEDGFHELELKINTTDGENLIKTKINADLGYYMGKIADKEPFYAGENVDITEKPDGSIELRNIVLFNPDGKRLAKNKKTLNIFYGMTNEEEPQVNNNKIEPKYYPTKMIVYEVDSPTRINLPKNCGIRPSEDHNTYREIGSFDITYGMDINETINGLKVLYDEDRVKLEHYHINDDKISMKNTQFAVTFPPDSKNIKEKGKGYVVEIYYKIPPEEVERFRNNYIQTIVSYDGPDYISVGMSQMKPKKNSSTSNTGKSFEIDSNNHDLTIYHYKNTGKFIVKKVNESDETLSDAWFTLSDDKGNLIKEEPTNSNGLITFDNLNPGRYTLTESVAPNGYTKVKESVTVIVNDETGEVSFEGFNENSKLFKSIKGVKTKKRFEEIFKDVKVSQDLEYQKDWRAFMNIYSKVISVDKTSNTVKSRIYLNPVKDNNYGNGPDKVTTLYLSDSNANELNTTVYKIPSGTKKDDFKQNIDAIDSLIDSNEAEIANDLISKKDKYITFKGDRANRWNQDAYVVEVTTQYDALTVKPGETNSQQRVVNYTWIEENDITYVKGSVGANVYLYSKEVTDPSITGDNIKEFEVQEPLIIEVVNPKSKAKVTIVKVDEDDTKHKIPGAKFEIFHEGENTPIKQKDGNDFVITGADGKATFEDLEPGKTYVIYEKEAPNGYEKTNKFWKVVVGEGNNVIVYEFELDYTISNPGLPITVDYNNKPSLSIIPSIIKNNYGKLIGKLDIESKYVTDDRELGFPLIFRLDNKNFKFKYKGEEKNEIDWAKYQISNYYGKQSFEFEIIPQNGIKSGEYQPITEVIIGEGRTSNKLPVLEVSQKMVAQKGTGENSSGKSNKYEIIQSNQFYNVWKRFNDGTERDISEIKTEIGRTPNPDSFYLNILVNPLYYKSFYAQFEVWFDTDLYDISTADKRISLNKDGYSQFTTDVYEKRQLETYQYTIKPKKDVNKEFLQPIKEMKCGGLKVEASNGSENYFAYLYMKDYQEPDPSPNPEPNPDSDPTVDVTTEDGNEFTITVTNKYRGFNVEFLKVNDVGETLDNAEFELKKYNEETYKYEDYKTTNQIKSTDGGKISIEGLKPGEYKLYETKAPAGYNKRLGAVVQFKIDEKDGHVEVYYKGNYVPIDNDNKKIVNYNSKNGKLIIKKTDSLGQPLPGAIFGLFIEDKEIYRNNMDENGKIIFENIKPGVYILKEIKAPDGYDKTNLTWTVTVYPTGYTTVKANPYKPIDTTHTPVDVGKEGKLEVKNYNFIVQDKPDSKTLKPNQKEFFEISYEIVPKDETNPGFKEGDFFTTQYSKNIRRQGTLNTYTPDDIVVDQGVLAVASYEKRKNDDEGDVVKYTFTKLVEDLSEDLKISIKESLNIDRKAVPYSDQNVNFVNKIAGNEFTNNGGDGFDIDYRVYYNKATNTSSDFVYQIFDNGKIYLSSFINKIDWSNNTLNFISYAKFENFSPNKVKINLSNVKGAVIDSKSKVNVYKVPSKDERTISQSFSSEYNDEKGLYSEPLVENQDYEVDYYDNSADLYINDPNSSAIYIIELTTAYNPSVEDAEIRENIICRQNPHCYYPFSVYSSIIIKPSETSAYGKTSQPEIVVKNYKKPDIEFQKVDGDDKAVKLSGAEFTLYKADNDENVNNELKFGMVNKDFEFVEDEKEAYKVISGEDGKLDKGKFKFEGLEDGIYAVKETKAPKDYALLTKYAFFFKVEGGKIYRVNELGNYIDSNKKDVKDEKKDSDSLIVDMEKDTAQVNPIQIENFKAEYPSTGGVGALPFVFIGMMIMMVGAYMFIRRRDALYE